MGDSVNGADSTGVGLCAIGVDIGGAVDSTEGGLDSTGIDDGMWTGPVVVDGLMFVTDGIVPMGVWARGGMERGAEVSEEILRATADSKMAKRSIPRAFGLGLGRFCTTSTVGNMLLSIVFGVSPSEATGDEGAELSTLPSRDMDNGGAAADAVNRATVASASRSRSRQSTSASTAALSALAAVSDAVGVD